MMGSSAPVHFGSFINRVEWKGLSFSANLMYKAGYYFFKNSFSSVELIGSGGSHADYYDRWQQPGDELHTNVPAFVYTDYTQYRERDNFYRYSTVNVAKGDHIRLHYINLGYRLPLNRTKVACSVYANMANIGILWRANKEGIDPEAPVGTPSPRQYTIGLKADF